MLTIANSLVGSGHIDKAAIISAAGDSTWSASSGFEVREEPPGVYNVCHNGKDARCGGRMKHMGWWGFLGVKKVKPDEMKTLVSILNDATGAVDKAHSEGIHVNGERFVITRIEDRSIYARQVGIPSLGSFLGNMDWWQIYHETQGRTGVCIVKTKQAILVGHYGENQQAGNATQTVEALADYLIKVGY